MQSFFARIVTGRGRGKAIGSPTLNLEPSDVPDDLEEGIYACLVTVVDGRRHMVNHPAVMHHGPRPVFNDTPACEVHLLDEVLDTSPPSATVEVVERLRAVENFPSVEALQAQIVEDIANAHTALARAETKETHE